MNNWRETDLGFFPDTWKVVSVKYLVDEKILEKPKDGNHGGIHPKYSDFKNSGIPFIVAGDIMNGKIDLNNCKFISQKQAGTLAKGFAYTGDVLLTHKATLGRTAIVGKIKTPYLMLTPQVTYYRVCDPHQLNSIYLKYFFDSSIFQKTLNNYASSGSTRNYVGITAQLELPILLPPLPIQNSIAEVLRSLDDKIDLLHRQNKTLEALAETLFRQWFVEQAQDDWGEGILGDLLETIESGSRPKGGIDPNLFSGVPSIGAENINGLGIYDYSKTKYITNEFFDKMKRGIIKDYDVLIYKDGAYIGRKSMFANGFPHTKCCVNEHVFILRSNTRANQIYLYYLMNQDELSLLNANSAQPGLNQTSMKSFEITIPSKERMDEFSKLVKNFIDKIFKNCNQIRTLETLRDTLLPKLMNGKVRVNYDKNN